MLSRAVYDIAHVYTMQKCSCLLLFSGKQVTDDVQLSELSLRPGVKIMMMGTREEELAGVMEPPSMSVDVINDFDIEDDEIAIQDRYVWASRW